MSSDTPAGNPERAPAAFTADGDPVETLRRITAALPALREAAGAHAKMADLTVASGDWNLIRDGVQTMAESDPTRQRVAPCLPYGDALVSRLAVIKIIRARADADDLAAVEEIARAVARSAGRYLPERAEAEMEIEAALNPNPPAPVVDWPRENTKRAEAAREARGLSPVSAPWVCLYGYERLDGGPEEGGWAYDWLTPIACWRTADFGDPRDAEGAARAYAADRGLIVEGDPDARPVSSACSVNRVDAYIGYSAFPFAEASKERPRYE